MDRELPLVYPALHSLLPSNRGPVLQQTVGDVDRHFDIPGEEREGRREKGGGKRRKERGRQGGRREEESIKKGRRNEGRMMASLNDVIAKCSKAW